MNEEYTTKRDKKTTENQDGNNEKGLIVHAGLLPILTFTEKSLFRKREISRQSVCAFKFSLRRLFRATETVTLPV